MSTVSLFVLALCLSVTLSTPTVDRHTEKAVGHTEEHKDKGENVPMSSDEECPAEESICDVINELFGGDNETPEEYRQKRQCCGGCGMGNNSCGSCCGCSC